MFIKEPSNIQVCIKTCTAVSGSNVNILSITEPELGTLEWWISGLMRKPLFLLISRQT